MPRDRCTTSRLGLFRYFLHGSPAAISSAILSLALITSLPAQERVRTSALQLPIESYRRSPDAFFYVGPFQEVLYGSVGVQYTDNVNLAATDRISDLSFFQALSLDTTWVISHLNQLEFTFGGQLTENFYGNGLHQLTLSIDPNSKLEFKFALGDFEVRLYNQFSYTQNPTNDPTATNTANLNSLTNTIGAVVDADLNIATLSFLADYSYNNESGQNAAGQANPTTTGSRETFRVGPTLTFRLSPTITYGVNAIATRTTGVNAANVNTLNIGPFATGKLNRDFEFDLAAGLSLINTTPSFPPGYYFGAAIRWQLNRHWQVLFGGSHDLIFTTGTGLTEENLFRIGTQLQVTRAITFSVAPFINFGDVKTTDQGPVNQGTGTYNQFGIEASVGWRPRKRWSTALTYDYIRRESGTTAGTNGAASDSYIQNTIALQVNYAF
jgi:hypothetical protein